MPTKIYRIKMHDFWINVSYSPPHYPRQKNKEIEIAENEINAFKSQQVLFLKSQKVLPFHSTDFGHFNSYSFEFNSRGGSSFFSKGGVWPNDDAEHRPRAA